MLKSKDLIERVVNSQSVTKTITEAVVVKGSDRDSISIVPDNVGKAKAIIEKHFKSLAEELDKDKIGYNAHIGTGYASISFGRNY